MGRATNRADLGARAVRNRLIAAGICAAVLAGAAGFAPWVERGPGLCLFYRLTGNPCLACGITRAVCCTMRGDLRPAVEYHPFGPIAVAALASATLLLTVEAIERRRITWFERVLFSPAAPWVLAAGLLVCYVVRFFCLSRVLPGE